MAAPTTLLHLTLNTGDVRESPRSEVCDDVIALLRPLITAGGGRLPGFAVAYTVELWRHGREAIFTIWTPDHAPILTGGLAQDDPAPVWAALQPLLDPRWSRGPHAPMPPTTPWLAVVLLPSAAATPRNDLMAFGDFERCLAWTVIEEAPQ